MKRRFYEGEYFMVGLCCNDYRNGNFEGKVCSIQISDLKLATKFVDWSPRLRFLKDKNGKSFMVIATKRFPIHGYVSWYGNWCWDAVKMKGYDVIHLLNWLKKKDWFQCEEGETRMFNLWESDGEYAEEDIRILKKADIAA